LPLGTVVEINAVIVAGRSIEAKEFMGAYLLKVTKVASNTVPKPPNCEFQTYSWDDVKIANNHFSLYELKKGKKTGHLSDSQIAELERGYVGHSYRLLAYEEGVYSGVPANLPEDYLIWQGHAFDFRTHLVVLRIIADAGKPNLQDEMNERRPSGSATNSTSMRRPPVAHPEL
jgi:hypothetical protein